MAQKVSKKIRALSLFAFSFIPMLVSAATLQIDGNYRMGSNLFNNLDAAAGQRAGTGDTTAFLEHRILLKPTVIVDDRFNIKSEMILGDVFGLNPNTHSNYFGNVLDSSTAQGLSLKRAWLEWSSDWGIFRMGRMPKAWGLGVLYHAGDHVLDDAGSTADRAAFQALLGNLGFNVSYEKGQEGKANYEGDDIDVYEVSLDYTTPESLFDVGILWTRSVVNASAGHTFLRSSSAHDLSIFSSKKWSLFQLAGEFVSTKYDAGQSGVGFLGQADSKINKVSLGADFAYASANASGGFVFHKNYKPFLILFNQSVGQQIPASDVRNSGGFGSSVANGDGAGGILLKARVAYGFDQDTYILGTDLGFAKLARQGSNASSTLGTEWDVHLKQKWYDNFDTYYTLGFLFPGGAFAPNQQVAWGMQIRGALRF